MKLFLAGAVLVSVLAAVSAMFGAYNALNKRFPGSRPISLSDYHALVTQQQEQRRPVTPRPSPNWMFQPRPQSLHTPVSRFPQDSLYPRPQNPRPRVPSRGSVRGNSDERDFSREDD